MADKFKDECGVFGVYNHPDAVTLTARGLLALQHRGQDSAGIAVSVLGELRCRRVMGPASGLSRVLRRLRGSAAIGHVRYATAGRPRLVNAQPIVAESSRGPFATCHNGHVINADALRQELVAAGVDFAGDGDTEVMARLFARSRASRGDADALRATLGEVTGAYSILMLTPHQLYAVRDPFGIRPLSLGRLGDGVVISSETAGLDAVGAVHVRDVAPGELLVLDGAGVTSSRVGSAPSAAQCVFELVYFSRPDSVVFGEAVAPARIGFGRRLAEEAPADADLVVPVPDSGTYAALGFAQQSGLPYEPAILRSHAVRRTFIEPTTTARRAAIALKYAPIRALLAGRRVVLVDDSIVRGSTCRQLVAQLRAAGAREVHLRIASPPTIGPCHYGVDTPDPSDLFATGRSIDDMAADLGADSLAHLSLDGLFATLRSVRATYCAGCYSGVYPIHAAAAAPVAVTVPMQRLRRRSA